MLAGVGVVGLAGFTYFGLKGLAKENDLEEKNCEPNCPQSDSDDLEKTYLLAHWHLKSGAPEQALQHWALAVFGHTPPLAQQG